MISDDNRNAADTRQSGDGRIFADCGYCLDFNYKNAAPMQKDFKQRGRRNTRGAPRKVQLGRRQYTGSREDDGAVRAGVEREELRWKTEPGEHREEGVWEQSEASRTGTKEGPGGSPGPTASPGQTPAPTAAPFLGRAAPLHHLCCVGLSCRKYITDLTSPREFPALPSVLPDLRCK